MKIQSKAEGAELISIQYNGKERLHDGKTAWKRHSPILFPIVGKLKDDETKIKGCTYQMTQHGFARDMIFETIEYKENVQSYMLKSNEETITKFPYDFILTVTYYLNNNTVTTEYKVLNSGKETMPFGIGGHPAYKLDYGKNYIEFEYEEEAIRYQLEEGLISKEEKVRIGKQFVLNQDSFKNDAIIWKGLKSKKIWVKNKETNQEELEFTFKDFPYLAIWSKENAPFLCIEPWCAVADKKENNTQFVDKEGTIFLKPKDEFICSYSVKF